MYCNYINFSCELLVVSNLCTLCVAGGMEKRQRADAVYITNLADDTTAESIADMFGSIGVIKVLPPRQWVWPL